MCEALGFIPHTEEKKRDGEELQKGEKSRTLITGNVIGKGIKKVWLKFG